MIIRQPEPNTPETLLEIYHNIGNEIFPLLEKAESEGKKLAIDEESLPDFYDEFSKDQVIIV